MNKPHMLKFKTCKDWIHENADYIIEWVYESIHYDHGNIREDKLVDTLIEFAKEENVFLIDQNTADWQVEIEKYVPNEPDLDWMGD